MVVYQKMHDLVPASFEINDFIFCRFLLCHEIMDYRSRIEGKERPAALESEEPLFVVISKNRQKIKSLISKLAGTRSCIF